MPIDSKIMISQALKGPVRRIAAEHVMNCYVIWDFAENKDGAQKFLIDCIDHFHEGFVAGQFYNFPCFPSTVPDLQKLIASDDRAQPARQVQGPRQRPRLGDERRLPGLRDGGHLGSVQHVGPPDDVRESRPRRREPGRRREGGGGGVQANLRALEVSGRLQYARGPAIRAGAIDRWRSSKPT